MGRSQQPQAASTGAEQRMRVDKWLWAARFFRTRSLAKQAIEGGKVHHQQERVKVSKDIHVGMELSIRQGFEEKTVIVRQLTDIRGGAPAAQMMYEETPASIAKRELIAAHRKLSNLARPDHRPTKRDRRQIHRFQQDNTARANASYDSNDEGF
ncbi:MAG: S4 domain-containing protein [Pseudomonadota bacterium]|nr:S4 domain-containing protein [Pseudomonadota bacterium]